MGVSSSPYPARMWRVWAFSRTESSPKRRGKEAGKKKSISLSCVFGRPALGDAERNSKDPPYPLTPKEHNSDEEAVLDAGENCISAIPIPHTKVY